MVGSKQGESGFLSRERSIAGPGFNRWLVPPAALAIHLCIGMAYGFSVFWLPLSKAIGISEARVCGPELGLLGEILASDCDWKISLLGWTFTLFFVFLGSAAALFGGWLETAGPRKAGVVSALCWCGGLLLSALGVYLHQLLLIWFGAGVIGGIGLGLGYISPVSTLIKWFPDRRGLATGLAIMGFGGGAMIGAPLADRLMTHFATSQSVGVWQTFVVLALGYFVFMMAGALGYRVPATGWAPAGFVPPPPSANAMVTSRHVHVDVAWKTPQFWLLWSVLCLNVSAGIGVLAMASPMLQEIFGGRMLGLDLGFDALNALQKKQLAAIAAGFTGLLSLCNIGGRIFWASGSDWLGRKLTYAIFFVLGLVLYALIPGAAHAGNKLLFVFSFGIILSMYGGGFATIPAYLADIFGTEMVGAIHGRLLTAWSTAGVLGPVLVNYLREYQISHGVPKAEAYDRTMYVLAALLLLGFFCNLLVRPVDPRYQMSDEEVAALRRAKGGAGQVGAAAPSQAASGASFVVVALAWLGVGLPLAWGISVTLGKAAAFFR